MTSKNTNKPTNSDDPKKKERLGKGLAILIGDKKIAETIKDDSGSEKSQIFQKNDNIKKLPIEFIVANPKNPRRHFPREDLMELAGSIRQKGVFQPILVRKLSNKQDKYEIIAGERRWRAAQIAALHEIPVVIRDVTDQEALELAIIENIQRTDLNPLEEAKGYDQLISKHLISQGDLGKAVGKSRSHIANTLRLLKLPKFVRDLLTNEELTAGHARALLSAAHPIDLAKKILSEGLSVRETETLAGGKLPDEKTRVVKNNPRKDADTKALEKRLSDGLGMNIAISNKASGRGELKIKYDNLEQLDNICDRLERVI